MVCYSVEMFRPSEFHIWKQIFAFPKTSSSNFLWSFISLPFYKLIKRPSICESCSSDPHIFFKAKIFNLCITLIKDCQALSMSQSLNLSLSPSIHPPTHQKLFKCLIGDFTQVWYIIQLKPYFFLLRKNRVNQ